MDYRSLPCAVTLDLNRYMDQQDEAERMDRAIEAENAARREQYITALKRNREQLAALLIDKIEYADFSPALLASLILALAHGGNVGDESPAECAKRLIDEACEADADVEVKEATARDIKDAAEEARAELSREDREFDLAERWL